MSKFQESVALEENERLDLLKGAGGQGKSRCAKIDENEWAQLIAYIWGVEKGAGGPSHRGAGDREEALRRVTVGCKKAL